jgi:hypothetical protein
MKRTGQNSLNLVLAGLLMVGFAAPMAGCGARPTFNVPDPNASAAPAEIGVITVTVIDNNSQPVAGANVSLTDGSGKPIMAAIQSGADGTAAFKKVAAGTNYTITADKGGVTGSQTGLGIDSESPLVVKVMLVPADTGLGTVGGSITDGLSGQPLDGATVSVMGTQRTVKAQADGSFLLKNVPVGNPTVVAIMPGYRENRANVVLSGGKLERADLKLYPSGDAARLGHTVIAMAHSVLEVDRLGNRVASLARGGYQAHPLPNGNTLISGSGTASEVNANNVVLWSYQPLLFGRLRNPQGVSKSATGTYFIADTDNNRVLEIGRTHAIQTTIKASFNHPCSVEREDATHTTLVADTGNNRVIEVDDSGTVVWGVAINLLHPTYAARLPNGDTLISDSGNHRILQINRAQGMRFMYGGDGKRETCYFPNSAQGLPNGHTLIADTGNQRVIEVDGKGAIVWKLATAEQPMFAERL